MDYLKELEKLADSGGDVLGDLWRSGKYWDDVVEGGTSTLSGQWQTVNESMSDFSRAYQKQITGQEGMAWVQNGVKFDGVKDGVLLDAKGEYAQFINPNTGEFYGWFTGKQDLLDETALDVVRDLFMNNGITEIELIFKAPK